MTMVFTEPKVEFIRMDQSKTVFASNDCSYDGYTKCGDSYSGGVEYCYGDDAMYCPDEYLDQRPV